LKQKLHPEGHLNKTAVVGAEIQTEDPWIRNKNIVTFSKNIFDMNNILIYNSPMNIE
jgi:hypothetical protein